MYCRAVRQQLHGVTLILSVRCCRTSQALSIHWAKALLEDMMGPDLLARFPAMSVDSSVPTSGLKWDTVDARNGEVV